MVDDFTARLAARIRTEREARGWTLAGLAQRAAVSRAMIAKIESGRSSPTAALLGKLSGALGLTMSTLLARVEAAAAAPERVSRREAQAVWRDPGSGYLRRQVLPVPGSRLPLELVHVELPAGAALAFPAASYAFIRQLMWVLEGELLFVEGDDSHRLRRGDALELGPPRDCRFENRGRGRCVYAVLILRGDAPPAAPRKRRPAGRRRTSRRKSA